MLSGSRNNSDAQLNALIGQYVTSTAILAHYYYNHPDSIKDRDDVIIFFNNLVPLFAKYLFNQIDLGKTEEALMRHANNFINIVVEEEKKILEEKAKKELKDV